MAIEVGHSAIYARWAFLCFDTVAAARQLHRSAAIAPVEMMHLNHGIVRRAEHRADHRCHAIALMRNREAH